MQHYYCVFLTNLNKIASHVDNLSKIWEVTSKYQHASQKLTTDGDMAYRPSEKERISATQGKQGSNDSSTIYLQNQLQRRTLIEVTFLKS